MPKETDDRLVESLYESILEPSLWPQTLIEFARQFGAMGGQFFVWDARKDKWPFVTFGGLPMDDVDVYEAYYASIDPRREHVMRARVGDWMLCHRQFDDHFIARSEFYQDFLLPGGTRFGAATRLIDENDKSALIALVRPIGAQPFGAEDEQRLVKLTPHLQRVARLHMKLAAESEKAGLLESLVGALSDALVTATADGTVRYCNAAAEARFRLPHFPLAVKNGVLVAKDQNAAALLRLRLVAAVQGVGGAVSLAFPRSPLQVVHLTLCPLSVRLNAMRHESEPQVLILMTDPSKPGLPSAETLQLLFGLTSAEAKLALALAGGKSLEEHAVEARIAMSTVRTQLSNILSKTGARRQGEVVSRVLSLRAGA
jgi:DNA-binding CsgD family transcriptional regulator/PAS domain-containing protein